MTCQEIQNLLPAYREDILSLNEKSAIETHLSSCSRCRQSMADLKETAHLLKTLEEVEPPPFFEQRIMTQVREEAGRRRGILQKFFFPLHIKIPIQAVASVLIAVLAVTIYQNIEPEMKRVSPLTAPISEPAKGQKTVVPPSAPKSSPPVTPFRQAPAGSLLKKSQQPFAPAPPAAVSQRDDRTADLIRPRQEEKPAGEKAGAPILALKDKEDSPVEKPALSQNQQRVEAAVAAKKGTILDLTIQVRDTNLAVREIEDRLGQSGARIIEKRHQEGRGFLKAELVSEKIPLFLDRLKAVGHVLPDKKPLDVQEGKVTVSIQIITQP